MMRMNKMNDDYSTIENPYNDFLQRSISNTERSLSSLGTEPISNNSDGVTSKDTKSSGGSSGANGNVENQPVRSDGAMGDVWIKNFIRSENWKPKSVGFAIDGLTGNAEFNNVFVSGNIQALTGSIGGWTIGNNELYATTTGTIKTSATVGTGSNGVILDKDGLRVYDSVLGQVVNLPSNGDAPTFSSGIINETTFEISTNAVLRTSATVGDGTANSAGILINNTGFYGVESNQTLADANVKILINGSAFFSGTITATAGTIGSFTIGTYLYTGSKTAYNDTNVGIHIGSDGIGIGNNVFTVSSAGAVSVVGGIITGGTIQTATSGARLVITGGTERFEAINANGDINATLSWASTTAAVLKLTPIYNARRALEIIIPASFTSGSEGDAKAITIDNSSDSISIDMSDAGSTGMNITGASISGITITHSGTGAGIEITASGSGAGALVLGGGDYPSIDITQNGTATNSYGIRLTQDTNAIKHGLFVDCNANSSVLGGIYIDRDGSVDTNMIYALRLDANNAGTGTGVGINFGSYKTAIFSCASDTTAVGAAVGRIPIVVGGVVRYLAYYAT